MKAFTCPECGNGARRLIRSEGPFFRCVSGDCRGEWNPHEKLEQLEPNWKPRDYSVAVILWLAGWDWPAIREGQRNHAEAAG